MRAERLRRTRDIENVRASGVERTDPHFTMRALRNEREVVRVAVAAPRSLGTAVRRSRARRRVREAIRGQLRDRTSARGTDILVVTRRPAIDAPAGVLRAAVARELEAVL